MSFAYYPRQAEKNTLTVHNRSLDYFIAGRETRGSTDKSCAESRNHAGSVTKV